MTPSPTRATWRGFRPIRCPTATTPTRYAPRPEAARAFRERYGISPTARVVLSAAKLTRNKGHDVAIAALNRLTAQGLDLVYVVCGDGQLEGELVSIARRCGLPSVFTGLLGTRDMIAAYSAADLVVHPSAAGDLSQRGRRGHGLRASGDRGGRRAAPPSCSDATAPRACSCRPADADALAEAVGGLLGKSPTGSRQSARRPAGGSRSEFPIGRMIDGYEHALGEVVGKRG